MEDAFTLDGREFRGVSQALSAAQDDYLVAHLRRSGAIEALTNQQFAPEIRAEEVLTRIMLSGQTHAILAGCLTECGKKWTHAEAEKNAQRFAEITDAAEKAAMRAALIGFVIGFFASGARSSRTFQKSSGPNDGARSTKNADPPTQEISPLSSATSLEASPGGSPR